MYLTTPDDGATAQALSSRSTTRAEMPCIGGGVFCNPRAGSVPEVSGAGRVKTTSETPPRFGTVGLLGHVLRECVRCRAPGLGVVSAGALRRLRGRRGRAYRGL